MTQKKDTILVVDDEEIMREVLRNTLEREGYSVLTADDGMSGFRTFKNHRPPLIISDIQMSGMSGLELLKQVKQEDPEVMVIIMTAYGSVETAVDALRSGAFDYITKPFIDNEIRVTVRNALKQSELSRENRSLRKQLEGEHQFQNIIGKSHRMLQIFRIIEKVSHSDTNVLVTGESGTGKELVSRAIHRLSHRAKQAFVSINCSAIPETLIESELFGHVKGAFTHAIMNKQGIFEEAHQGTLFLDEIGELPIHMQPKLLRAIETGEIKPVGGNKTKKVDIRLICATNKHLEKEVVAGNFREDLYYRLNVVNIHLPALRERTEDIPSLAQHFLDRYCKKYNIPKKKITKETLRILINFRWPGNVRELENCMERVVALSDGEEVLPEDLPPAMINTPFTPVIEIDEEGIVLDEVLKEFEVSMIMRALSLASGNISRAARLLHINRRTLSSRMQKLGIQKTNNHQMIWRKP